MRRLQSPRFLRYTNLIVQSRHWYKGNAANSLKSAQRPLDKKPPAGMTARGKQKYKREKYVQVIGFDYLVVEEIELNLNKQVKH
jgi:hypothetical protein